MLEACCNASSGPFMFQIQKVLYPPAKNDALQQCVDDLVRFIENGVGAAPAYIPRTPRRKWQSAELHSLQSTNIFPLLVNLVPYCFTLKSAFFKEEDESRIIVVFDTDPDWGRWLECDFRATGDRIIPFRTFPDGGLRSNAITKVVLGPRNGTPEGYCREMLGTIRLPSRKRGAIWRDLSMNHSDTRING